MECIFNLMKIKNCEKCIHMTKLLFNQILGERLFDCKICNVICIHQCISYCISWTVRYILLVNVTWPLKPLTAKHSWRLLWTTLLLYNCQMYVSKMSQLCLRAAHSFVKDLDCMHYSGIWSVCDSERFFHKKLVREWIFFCLILFAFNFSHHFAVFSNACIFF